MKKQKVNQNMQVSIAKYAIKDLPVFLVSKLAFPHSELEYNLIHELACWIISCEFTLLNSAHNKQSIYKTDTLLSRTHSTLPTPYIELQSNFVDNHLHFCIININV